MCIYLGTNKLGTNKSVSIAKGCPIYIYIYIYIYIHRQIDRQIDINKYIYINIYV